MRKVTKGAFLRRRAIFLLALAHLAALPTSKTARAEDARTLRLNAGLRHRDGAQPRVIGAAFSPDGKTLASASYRVIKLWSSRAGDDLGTVTAEDGWISGMVFLRDGRTIVTAGGRVLTAEKNGER